MLQTPCDRMHQIHKLTIKYFPHHFSLHSFRWICSSCCQSNVHADCQGLCQRLDKDGYVQQGTKPLLKCVLKADAVYLFSAALFVSPVLFLVFFFPSFLYEPLNRLVCTICGTCVHTHPPFVFFYVAAHPSAHSPLTLTSALFHISFINMLFPILLFSQSDPMCIVYLKSQETGNQYREIVRNLVRYKARVSSLFCLISPKHITQP